MFLILALMEISGKFHTDYAHGINPLKRTRLLWCLTNSLIVSYPLRFVSCCPVKNMSDQLLCEENVLITYAQQFNYTQPESVVFSREVSTEFLNILELTAVSKLRSLSYICSSSAILKCLLLATTITFNVQLIT